MDEYGIVCKDGRYSVYVNGEFYQEFTTIEEAALCVDILRNEKVTAS